MTKRYLTPWTFLNWIVYFKFNINLETFKNSDQVWKQNYKLWAPGPSLGSGGKHKKGKGKQSLRILYYFCVNTLVLLLHSPPAIQNCWVLWRNWFTCRSPSMLTMLTRNDIRGFTDSENSSYSKTRVVHRLKNVIMKSYWKKELSELNLMT